MIKPPAGRGPSGSSLPDQHEYSAVGEEGRKRRSLYLQATVGWNQESVSWQGCRRYEDESGPPQDRLAKRGNGVTVDRLERGSRRWRVRRDSCRIVLCVVAVLVAAIPGYTQRELAKSPKMMSAKTVYFEDRTGADAVAAATVAQLKKWGRFQVVKDKKEADLIFMLSADPYKGGYIVLASGGTGTMDENGNVKEDRVPNYNVQAPVRDAYLSVIDPKEWPIALSVFAPVGRGC